MGTFADMLSYLRRREHLSQQELAEKLGLAKSTISMYEKGARKPSFEVLEAIADYFNVNMDTLVGKPVDDPSPLSVFREIDPIYDALNGKGQKELCRYGRYLGTQEEYRAAGKVISFGPPIPHFFTAAAAGYAAPIEGQDYELVERDADTPAESDFCIEIDGDSMEPYIHDGQRVYVKRDTTDLAEFDVGIFYVDGDVLCKQWCRDYVGALHLLSANPRREDANRMISRSSGQTVLCYGKVLLPRRLPRPEYKK